MSVLDGDGGVLKDSANNVASRDIVQFVPFSKYPEVSRYHTSHSSMYPVSVMVVRRFLFIEAGM